VTWIYGGLVGAVAVAFVVFLVLALRRGGASLWEARQIFQARRADLEAAFFAAASASGKPRGLRWKACEW
jgi:hypothetical protein